MGESLLMEKFFKMDLACKLKLNKK